MISVCIPAYEQTGSVRSYFRRLLRSIATQKDAEFEVIVSDNSNPALNGIEEICADHTSVINLRYHRNRETIGISNNTNHAIGMARSDRIKIMYQDDLFIRDDALFLFEKALEKRAWAVASYLRVGVTGDIGKRHDPVYPDNMLLAKNTIGMPSVLGIRRNGLRFDPNLRTRLDCEYYWQLYREYGEPEYIREAIIGCRYWHGSASRMQGNCSQAEYQYLREKYKVGHDGRPVAALTLT